MSAIAISGTIAAILGGSGLWYALKKKKKEGDKK
jgi:LPXTG-motif cell wall-anchored protein